jgi:hypothetical protein
MEIIGYELGNSARDILPETWQHNGVLDNILGPLLEDIRAESGGTGPVSANELFGLLQTYFERRTQTET